MLILSQHACCIFHIFKKNCEYFNISKSSDFPFRWISLKLQRNIIPCTCTYFNYNSNFLKYISRFTKSQKSSAKSYRNLLIKFEFKKFSLTVWQQRSQTFSRPTSYSLLLPPILKSIQHQDIWIPPLWLTAEPSQFMVWNPAHLRGDNIFSPYSACLYLEKGLSSFL